MTATAEALADRAAQLLNDLGSTPNAVAERLFTDGHRGERGKCGACPIAAYLLSSDLGLHAVNVGTCVRLLPTDDLDDMVTVDLPDPVFTFIIRFDDGAYDELVTDGGEQA